MTYLSEKYPGKFLMPDDIQARCDLTQNHQIKLRIHNLLLHAISGAVLGDFRWFSVEFGLTFC